MFVNKYVSSVTKVKTADYVSLLEVKISVSETQKLFCYLNLPKVKQKNSLSHLPIVLRFLSAKTKIS